MRNLTLNVFLFFSLLVFVAGTILFICWPKKIAVVSTMDLFTGFDYTKKLDEKFSEIKAIRQSKLDSIELELGNFQREWPDLSKMPPPKQNEYNFLLKLYRKNQTEFQEDNQQLEKKYQEQIWSQLNEYCRQFGEKEKYDLILGANGQGSVMYAKESVDITKDLITYCNEKHKGK
jgi:outer membrane protein